MRVRCRPHPLALCWLSTGPRADARGADVESELITPNPRSNQPLPVGGVAKHARPDPRAVSLHPAQRRPVGPAAVHRRDLARVPARRGHGTAQSSPAMRASTDPSEKLMSLTRKCSRSFRYSKPGKRWSTYCVSAAAARHTETRLKHGRRGENAGYVGVCPGLILGHNEKGFYHELQPFSLPHIVLIELTYGFGAAAAAVKPDAIQPSDEYNPRFLCGPTRSCRSCRAAPVAIVQNPAENFREMGVARPAQKPFHSRRVLGARTLLVRRVSH